MHCVHCISCEFDIRYITHQSTFTGTVFAKTKIQHWKILSKVVERRWKLLPYYYSNDNGDDYDIHAFNIIGLHFPHRCHRSLVHTYTHKCTRPHSIYCVLRIFDFSPQSLKENCRRRLFFLPAF